MLAVERRMLTIEGETALKLKGMRWCLDLEIRSWVRKSLRQLITCEVYLYAVLVELWVRNTFLVDLVSYEK